MQRNEAAGVLRLLHRPSRQLRLNGYLLHHRRSLWRCKATRIDLTADSDSGATGSPDPAITHDTFSVRWTGQLSSPATDQYIFYAKTDDGLRPWVDDRLLIDA